MSEIFDPKGYYAVLNLPLDAGSGLIKQNYRDLAKLWHPDHNTAPDAMEKFQLLSAAYETLSDDRRRLVYDLLALVYTSADFPDVETIEPFRAAGNNGNVGLNRETGSNSAANIRVLNLKQVRGMLWTYRADTVKYYVTAAQALRRELKTSWLNWLLGWWSPQAFLKNIAALAENFWQVNPGADNLRLLVHNAVAYLQAGQNELAAQSAVMALDYASNSQRLPLQKLLSDLGIRVSRPRHWNFAALKLVQLSFPLALAVLALLPPSAQYLSEADLLKFWNKSGGIAYYQEVNFGARGRTVDDVVVGKVLNIPVDRSDLSKLYHLKSAQQVMYGPSEEFDILKKLPAGTTVRLTGISPDKIWARIMIDNGEMGFVRMEDLIKGIGNPVPDFSKVYQAN